jgi:secretion/DNA translocation related TadE-like protein
VRQKTRFVAEAGSGTLVSLGIIVAILSVLAVSFGITNRIVEQTRLNALADNAAIAAADSLRGLVAGYPCTVAAELASSANATVTICRIIGSDVQVELQKGGLAGRARAGEQG